MQKYLRRVLKVNDGELRKVLFLFVYFFLAIAAYYIVKPVRSSLFLDSYGPDKLPYIYIANAGFTLIVTFVYAALTRKFTRGALITFTNIFFITNLVVFWFFYRFYPSDFTSILFYVWVSNFNLILVAQFWSVAHDYYTPRKGKRLYGFIGSGGILGSIVAGLVVSMLVKRIGTENLLLVAAGILIAMVLITRRVWRMHEVEKTSREANYQEIDEVPDSQASGLGLVVKSRYLQLIAAIIVIMNVVSTVVDFQFNTVMAQTYSKDQMTAFLGTFFSCMTIASFVIQFFVTSAMHRKMGITFSLLVLPFVSAAGALAFFAVPIFAMGMGLKFLDGSLGYSIQQATKEVLYLPTSKAVKYRAKAFIDIFFFRFGDAIAAILILVCEHKNVPLRYLSLLVIGVSVMWTIAIFGIKKEYIECLRKLLSLRKSFKLINYDKAMKVLAPELNPQDYQSDKAIYKHIYHEVQNYYMNILVCKSVMESGETSAGQSYLKLLDSRQHIASRIFRLLSFMQPTKDLYHAYHYLFEQGREYDTLALELLDNIIYGGARKKILPFFDPDLTIEEKINLGKKYWKISTEQLYTYLLTETDLVGEVGQDEVRRMASLPDRACPA